DFIIADEPTLGLEENQGYMVMGKLAELVHSGKTIMLISHDLAMVKDYSNRIVAMHNHHIQLDIAAQDLTQYLEKLKSIGLDFQELSLLSEVKDGTC
ncbi:MAG: ABC transporter ATP-binding protein, partial [Peptococcaceae bacterium]|nr:ABC transporter ATP-binding protein [Peptococcaceae bacterium]